MTKDTQWGGSGLFAQCSRIKQSHLCREKPLMWFCLDMKSAERQMRWPSRWRRRRDWSVEGGVRQRGTFLIEGPSSLSFFLFLFLFLSLSWKLVQHPSLLVREINRCLPNHTLLSVYSNAAHLLGGAIISTLGGALLNWAIVHLPEVMTVSSSFVRLLLFFYSETQTDSKDDI